MNWKSFPISHKSRLCYILRREQNADGWLTGVATENNVLNGLEAMFLFICVSGSYGSLREVVGTEANLMASSLIGPFRKYSSRMER